MANIFGTGNADSIATWGVSPGVTGGIPSSANDWIYANSGDDYIYAGGGNDYIYAESGNDTLSGGSGNDTLDGGTGNDTMYGSAGNDTYYADSTGDSVIEYSNQGTDQVYAYISYTLGDNVENLTLLGNVSINGYGNALGNTMRGNDQRNSLYGRDGNDNLNGQGGNDYLSGANGNDTLDGWTGNDTLYGGGDNDLLWGWTGDDQLRGDWGNDSLYGEDGNDDLVGQTGSDYLSGGNGDDTLTGGSGGDGADTLIGGAGADRFQFFSAVGDIDTITDFTWQQGDKLAVWKSGFGNDLQSGALLWNQFRIGTSAQDADDRFIYNSNTGALFFDADGIGGQGQVQFASLSTGLNLISSDIVVV